MKKLQYLIIIVAALVSGCADFFQSKIAMDMESTPGNLVQLIVSESTNLTLGVSSQLFVSQGLYNNRISLSWNSVPNAAYYRLERAVVTEPDATGTWQLPDSGDFSVVSKFVYATSYTDVILLNPKNTNKEYGWRYYYRVCAENPRNGYEPGEFTVSTASSGFGYLFPPVESVSAEKGESTTSIKVDWTAVEGASSYNIYRSTNVDGSRSECVGTVPGNILFYKEPISAAEQGVEFYYAVYAVNLSGNTSVSSNLGMGFSAVEGAPVPPDDVTVSMGRGESLTSITITWTADTNVSDPVTQKKLFSVYRSSSIDSAFTVLKKNMTTGTYTDSAGLKPGVFYYYYIQAVQAETALDGSTTELKSSFSKSGPESESPAEGFILSPPSTVAVDDGSVGNSVIKWSPSIGNPTEQSQYEYAIFTDTNQNGSFSTLVAQIPSIAVAYDPDTDMYLYETPVAPFFKIRTINPAAENLASAFSMTVAPSPAVVTNTAVTKAAKINGAMNANANNVYPVKVTWTAPAGGAAGYYVYRSAKVGSGFRLLTEEPLTDTYLVDENDAAKPGVCYYYKVLALNSLKQGTHYSEPVDGYGALTPEQYFLEYNKTVKSSQKKLKLMHKANDLDKLGSESVSGIISGSLSYDAATSGLGARIKMHYSNYADFYIGGVESAGVYFTITGDTNTSASMDASGTMDGTVTCSGMYPGVVGYNNVQIKGGAAAGGYYVVTMNGFSAENVNWTWGDK